MLSSLSKYFNKIIVVKMNEENSITEDLLPKYLKLYFENSLTDSFKMINKLSSNQTTIYFGGSLYFIGEVIDVTGHLGGHNFQWAWSSGFVAGQNV